jgi:cytochrome P450
MASLAIFPRLGEITYKRLTSMELCMSDEPIQSLLETIAYDSKARVDPHPILKSVREHCPIFYDSFSKAYLLTRYQDVRNTVNDRTLWRHPEKTEEGALARMMVEPGAKAEFENNILFMDEPNHSRVRLPLQKAFYARITKHANEIE